MNYNQIIFLLRLILCNFALVLLLVIFTSCDKDPVIKPDPSDNLAIDSLVASKTDIVVWEKIYITAYTRGKNLTYKWTTYHGSMFNKDSTTVTYWGCPSCVGLNTVKCTVSNEFGTVYDTIMINVRPK